MHMLQGLQPALRNDSKRSYSADADFAGVEINQSPMTMQMVRDVGAYMR